MCTLVLLHRPGYEWPLLLATNRDERLDRPWLAPARHWAEYPGIVAGLDLPGGGSWLGVSEQGVVAGVMNRTGTLGPKPGMRSRGSLVLEALACEDAAAAVCVLSELDPAGYQAFNLVVADRTHAFWVIHRGVRKGEGRFESVMLPPGLSMFTDRERNDLHSPRIKTYLPEFLNAAEPDPGAAGGWISWIRLLAGRRFDPKAGPQGAMTLGEGGFGTVSSSLIALPSRRKGEKCRPIWRFAPGPPDRTPYQRVYW